MGSRRVAIILGVVGALAAVALAGTALAQTPTPTPGTSKQGQANVYAQHFLDRLAAALGVDRAKLDSSLKQAGNETVDKLVQDGKLTQEQGDRIKSQDKPFWFFGHGFGKGMPPKPGVRPLPNGGRAPGEAIALGGAEVREAIAGALGMSAQDVLTEIRGGKSLKQLAQEKGKEADVKAAILAVAKQHLDKAVASGGITRERADQMYARLENADLLAAYGHIWGRAVPQRMLTPFPRQQAS